MIQILFRNFIKAGLTITIMVACQNTSIKPNPLVGNIITINQLDQRISETDVDKSDMSVGIKNIEKDGAKHLITITTGGCEPTPRFSFYKRKISPHVRYSYDFFYIRFQTDFTCERLNTYTLLLDTDKINFASNHLKIITDQEERLIKIN